MGTNHYRVMKAFEYRSITEEPGQVDKLNEAAKEGWRVVFTNPIKITQQSNYQLTTYFIYILEREIE